jgi:G8 domain
MLKFWRNRLSGLRRKPAKLLVFAVFPATLTAAVTLMVAQHEGAPGGAEDRIEPERHQHHQHHSHHHGGHESVASSSAASSGSGSPWSSPSTWGGSVPASGADILIPAGQIVELDQDIVAGHMTIHGELRFARKNLSLTAKNIVVTGAWRIGTVDDPYQQQATITLTGPYAERGLTAHGTRGIMVHGGRLEWFGRAPSLPWLKLDEHLEAGSSVATLSQNVDWLPGSKILIGPTDWYGLDATEVAEMSALTGRQLALAQPSPRFRWGRLQYIGNQGVSLSPDPAYVPPALPAPTFIDERAPVANLSRRIVVQGIDDADWRNEGFGAHLMVMNLASKVVIDGAEFRRAGQSGILGRYPIHWHMLSYDAATGAELGDATGHMVRNSTVWNSQNRCIVVHATNGVKVHRNVCYDIRGHAFFLEDAVERRNEFIDNLALRIRSPIESKRLQNHEGLIERGGASGFWITNPDNTFRGNHAADAEGNGFWLSFPERPLGLSKAVSMHPTHLPLREFAHNTAHSTQMAGILFDFVPVNDAGDVGPHKYIPTSDGLPEQDYTKRIRPELKRITIFKSSAGAYRNRVSAPDYLEWAVADSTDIFMGGAVDDGLIARGLFIGRTLNNRNNKPYEDAEPPAAFASYHSTVRIQNNVVVNFPYVHGKPSGVFATGDFYTEPLEKGTMLHAGNRLIGSNVGHRLLPPHLQDNQKPNEHWSLAGAIWDPYGYAGPQGNYWVYDLPFLTAGADCVPVAPAGNGKSCRGEYYGIYVDPFSKTGQLMTLPLDVQRHDCSGSGTVGKPDQQCKWVIGDGLRSWAFGIMRHFTARPKGRYTVTFSENGQQVFLPTHLDVSITNAHRATDEIVLGLAFQGSKTAAAVLSVGQSKRPEQRLIYRPANTFQEVLDSNGDVMWQDRANNLVWVKVKGGRMLYNPPEIPLENIQPPIPSDIYNTMRLVIESAIEVNGSMPLKPVK